MALSDLSARVADAVVADMAPRVVNPYPNKVIHADIRIQSIDGEAEPIRYDIQAPGEGRPVESVASAGDVDYQEKAAEMQTWWAEAIARNMDLPEGYSHVAVLIIKWADQLDELKTGDEVRGRRGWPWRTRPRLTATHRPASSTPSSATRSTTRRPLSS